jgi:hypothetical protein
MARIELESGDVGGTYIIRLRGTKRTVLVQRDWDYPGVASSFGWSPARVNRKCPEHCNGTDGTITCPACRTPVGNYISSAADYLDRIADSSKSAEDPGYFA